MSATAPDPAAKHVVDPASLPGFAALHGRHFFTDQDYTREELLGLLDLAVALKAVYRRRPLTPFLEGRTLAMILEHPSTRTRISLEAGMTELGGHAQYLRPGEIHLGGHETVADTARVISRLVDAIMARTAHHATLAELAQHATVPVIVAVEPCAAGLPAPAGDRARRAGRRMARGAPQARRSLGANLDTSERQVSEAAGRGAQVVVLEELFATPYFCITQDRRHPDLAQPAKDHPVVAPFSRLAGELGVVLPVSFFERAGPAFFNSVAVIDADGPCWACTARATSPTPSATRRSSASRPATRATPFS